MDGDIYLSEKASPADFLSAGLFRYKVIVSMCSKSSTPSALQKVISNRISAGITSGILIMYSSSFVRNLALISTTEPELL